MRTTALLIALALILLGCVKSAEEGKIVPKQSLEVKTYCVGHQFVQIPVSFMPAPITTGIFKETGLGSQDPAFDVIARSAQLTTSEFASEMRKRGEELKAKGDDTVDVLRLEKKLSDHATLFRIRQIKDAYLSEINLLRGSSTVRVTLESYNGKFDRAEERLIAFAERVKEAPADITTAEARNFCFGLVTITGDFAQESGGLFFRNGKGDTFDIAIDNYISNGDGGLLSRMKGPDSLLTKFKVPHTVLRAGERTMAGMRAHEWLGWANLGEQEVAKTFKFALDTMPAALGRTSPNITLTFDSAKTLEDGTETKNWMTDKEAIELWDGVVASIRPTVG
jgi:hypothetical protein